MKTKHTLISVLMILAIVTTLCVVMAAPASATSVTVVTATPSPTTAGSIAQYVVEFTATTAGATSVTVTFPSGTVIPASILASSVVVDATPCTVAPTVMGNIVIVTAPAAITAAAHTITFSQAAAIKNPPLAKSTYTVKVHTSADVDDVTSSAYTIIAYVSFSPVAGSAGSAVTVIGAGFTPGVAVNLTGGVAGAGTVATDGTITIAGVAASSNVVTATDGAGISAASATAFAITASIAALPTSANASGGVQVTMTGLTAGNLYVLSLGGVTSAQAVDMISVATGSGTLVSPGIGATAIDGATASAGGMIICTITVPAGKAAGATVLYAKTSGGAGAFANAAAFDAAGVAGTATITINPRTVTVSPTSGLAGTAITLTGSGFGPFAAATGSTVTALGPTPVTFQGSTTFATDSTGAFTKALTMPTGLAAGTYYITATDSFTNSATGVFVIPASMPPSIVSMTPAVGPAGTSVTVAGKDFTPLTPVSLTFGGVLQAVGNADALGAISLTFTVPVATPGYTIVSLTDGIKTAAAGTFTVSISPAIVAPQQAFANIAGQFSKVWTFDASTQSWQLYDTAAGATSTLSQVKKGQGYWIQVSQDCTLTYTFNNYPLKAGWNLIGWLG